MTPTPPRRRATLLVLAASALLAFAASAPPAVAQVTRPWVPPGDSLMREVTTARMRFKRQQGDSLDGDNYAPFGDVGRIARRLVRSLGRDHVRQAAAVEPTLDSLGLDTEVVVDPATPGIVLVLVRNPFLLSSHAVGFLMWYLGDDLRMQGVSFPAARDARLRAWYTGRQQVPYEATVLYRRKGTPYRPAMKLFRMSPDGRMWNLVQYEGNGPEFGDRSQVDFVDANLDGKPELLEFAPVTGDSFFTLRGGVAPIVNEYLYTERPEGFVLHDARTLPGPAETLREFALFLSHGEAERAKRLLLKPERLADALAAGWARLGGAGAWIVEYAEQGAAWPEWLAVRTNDAAGPRRWIFRFFIQDGRWVIREWTPVSDKPAPGAAVPVAIPPADSARGGRP